ncbi:MAG: 16S rRNA (uracil(1498)-N(3))-methyltransferase [Acidimicrobiaceae bacterium]|nr:16S rRNA (uracil(1498)-N(3))-methyltransferase [Acidimicrobiaceae bacterium]
MTLELWSRRVAALGQFRVLDPAAPVLGTSDDHHLRKVLRAGEGEEIVVTDGRGTWSICEVRANGLARTSDVHVDPLGIETVLYIVPLKGDRSEWVVAKSTELGVSRIVPLLSERIAVKFKGDARDKVLARWRRIGAEACGQSRRTYDVTVEEPVQVRDVEASVAVADFDGDARWSAVNAVAVGPEGGWAPDEWGSSRRRLSLGPSVLRAETAAVVAASLVVFGSGDWGFTLEGR